MPSKFVTSSDGSKIYAEAVGDPTKPALVLVPGYMLSTMVFDKQFEDKELQKELYLVRGARSYHRAHSDKQTDTVRYARSWSECHA